MELPRSAAANFLAYARKPHQLSAPWIAAVGAPGDAPLQPKWRGMMAGLALPAGITILGEWLRTFVGSGTHGAPNWGGSNLAIFYMLAVIFSALRWGRRAAIVSAVASSVFLDFFFVPPYRSFVVGDLWYTITLFGLLAVALLVSILTVTATEEARAARRREAQATALYTFTKSLAEASGLEEILDAVARHIPATFRRSIIVMLPGAQGLTVSFQSDGLLFDEREKAAALWTFESGQETGCGTTEFSSSKIRYRPLKTYQGVAGVVGILAPRSADLLSPNDRQLLGAFLDQAALAVTRADLAGKARRIEMLQETDRLQKALLNSISHNLRTPITSVVGVLHSLVEDSALFDAATRMHLLEMAQDEALKLNRLVQNLLDMSRLEGGAVRVKAEPCDVNDVIGAALEQIGERARKRSIAITIAPDLPLVPMDQVLIVQVLVNMTDNALKYSPLETPIEIEARRDQAQLQILVGDRGAGIPEQDMGRVFDKFFRGAAPEAPGGAGLGLSICKGFIDAHHGHMWVRRRTRGGTEVGFALPLETQIPETKLLATRPLQTAARETRPLEVKP